MPDDIGHDPDVDRNAGRDPDVDRDARILTVVLADVVGSRDVPDREGFGDDLESALLEANDAHEDALVAPFVVLKGVDEFGGVLASPAGAYPVVRDLQAALHPEAARYAVVHDEVDVNPWTDDVHQMDGHAFHRADELLDELTAAGAHFQVETPGGDTGGGVAGDGSGLALDDAVSAAGDMALAIREEWTDRQLEVARAYRAAGTQREAAAELGISQQGVSRVLSQADYGRVTRAEERIRRAMTAMTGESGRP